MKKLSFALILLAAPATAQTVSLPGNCTAYLTVQSQGCIVEHYMTCTGDPEGFRHWLEIFADGYDGINTIDNDAQWILGNDTFAGGYEVLGAVFADPLSISNMIETGQDALDFTLEHSNGAVTRFVGLDRMTGATTIIDGITLLNAEYTLEAFDSAGTLLWRGEGFEYVSPGWRLYFGSATTWHVPGEESYDVTSAPVEFIMPGEPGFLSTTALYDCDTAE